MLSLCNGIKIFKIGRRYLFTCQDTSTAKNSEGTFSVFELSCHLLLPV